jgi:hypothetical protein
MADEKISFLPTAGPLTGMEMVPIVQSGVTVKVKAQNIASLNSSLFELQANKQNSLTVDGTGVKYPTVDAVNAGLVDVNTNAVNRVTVKLSQSINKGQAVYVSSASGTNIIVSKASNTSEATSSKTIGLLETTGATNAIVNVITDGLLAGLNTNSATIGDPVWLGVNGDLIYGLINKPYAPTHLVYIGVVTRVSATVGEILVKVQNGFELKEIHDVDLISNTPANNDVLQYESSTSLWKNKQIDNIFTIQFETGTLSPADATTYYFSDVRLAPNLTATNFNYNLGSAYTIIGARISIGNNVVSGTTELATLQIRNITQSTTSSLGTFRTDATSVSIKGTTFTGASISVAASDDIVAQIDFPTYANNPTSIIIFLTLICKK